MHRFKLTLTLLAALTVTACVSTGSHSTDSDGSTTASLSDNSRNTSKFSDSEITANVKRVFSQDDLLAKSNISVSTQAGIVSLSARLSAYAANRAISRARAVPGVRRVMWASIEYMSE
ncbi:MAG: hypothetical protein CSA09_00360 [Candidatus Contendobacter odensis]|uniref:BON domain-containing protein n=1 Tax=Candidatus Contendibacter odensensis TaxID=1400860 RepID=A0A2G6PGL6_9GAMM|nr:MAG: hypothetical protein CSA09_00360 [Candidatus Contendobacter odensis]